MFAIFKLIPNSTHKAKVSTKVIAMGINTSRGNFQPRKYSSNKTKMTAKAVVIAC